MTQLSITGPYLGQEVNKLNQGNFHQPKSQATVAQSVEIELDYIG